jgi:hypothetical protein
MRRRYFLGVFFGEWLCGFAQARSRQNRWSGFSALAARRCLGRRFPRGAEQYGFRNRPIADEVIE